MVTPALVQNRNLCFAVAQPNSQPHSRAMSKRSPEAQERLVYFNGVLVPESEARISIYDSALMFGDVAFEMTRSFNKRQFKLREHLERLAASARWLHLPLESSVGELEKLCQDVIAANEPLFAPDDEHRLMLNVTRGLLGSYANRVKVRPGPNLIIADFPLRWTVQDSAHLYTEGIDVVIPSQRMIPASLLEPKAKNRNRIHYLMANVELSTYTGRNAWAVLLDPEGFLTEGTGSNFFFGQKRRDPQPGASKYPAGNQPRLCDRTRRRARDSLP